jgi:hypothetical protein
MALRTGYAVLVHPDGASAALVTGIVSQSVMTNTEERREQTAGHHLPRHISLPAQKPVGRFASLNLDVALDACGFAGLAIASATNPGLVFYQVLLDALGQPSAGSVHRTTALRNGLLLPRSISCDHQGDARIGYECLANYDDTNAPLVYGESAALPSGYGDTTRFTLGPVAVNGVSITGKTSLEIDLGNSARTVGADSDVWDTSIEADSIMPRVMIRGLNTALCAAAGIPLAGKVGAHADSTIYLRKRLQTGTGFVADLTAEHIAFTLAGIMYAEDVFDANGNQHGECSLAMPLAFDGTNFPVTVDTTAALP